MEIILVGAPHFDRNFRRRRLSEDLNSTDPMTVANSVSSLMSELTTEQLNVIVERFGGIEAFVAKELNDDLKYLRNTLMRSESFSPETFKQIFDKTFKIGKRDAIHYVNQTYYLTDLERFKRIWIADRTAALQGIARFRLWSAHQSLLERLPMVHTEDCKGDEPGNMLSHYHCERPIIYRPDRARAIQRQAKEDLEAIVSQEVLEFVQDMVLSITSSTSQREVYAESLIVHDDHWIELARDPKRDVLNAVVQNILLPSDIALEIVTSHKTPFLREEIAKRTVDRNLLETIWNGTKSESIRKAVESNVLFRSL